MGISYYFMNKANKQVGPLSLDELKQRGITRETPVWREGMPNWVQAKNIPELHAYIVTPSPYINVVRLVLILYAILGSIVFLFAGKFVSAFIASCFNIYPYVPGFVPDVYKRQGRSCNGHRGWNYTGSDARINSFLDAPALLPDCHRIGLVVCHHIWQVCYPVEQHVLYLRCHRSRIIYQMCIRDRS